jgi:hypothetical protein
MVDHLPTEGMIQMATNTNTSAVATIEAADAVDADVSAVLARTGDDPIAILKEAYATAQRSEKAHRVTREAADMAMREAQVWQARIAYRAGTSEGIANSRYPFNITGAAKALGVPVATLRPYALAGEALHKADRAGILATPSKEDLTIVNDSFDRTSRADQKAKRVKEAAKKAALEAKAKELEALKAKQAGTPATGETPATGDVPATGDAQAPASGQQAPATGEAPAGDVPAQRGPSLEDDAVATARQLVAQIKKLRADKGWSKVAGKVVAILAEAFPVLSK